MDTVVSQPFCRSVFKDGSKTTTKEKLTTAWINMINTIESHKDIDINKDDDRLPSI